MKKSNPGKETLSTFLEAVEVDKLANKKDNAKKLGDACRAEDIPDDEEDNSAEGQINEAAFSPQHYQAIANILKNVRSKFASNEVKNSLQIIGDDLADLFEKNNKNFDREKFLVNSGLGVTHTFDNVLSKDPQISIQ